jgi:hypothetical protein
MSKVQNTRNPYEAPQASLDVPKSESGLLRCPYCEHAFPLTWKRYWLSFGKLLCPNCHRKSRIGTGAWYWFLYLPAMMVVSGLSAGLCLLILVLLAPQALAQPYGLPILVMLWTVSATLLLHLDRWVDTRFRRLHRLKESNVV